MRNTIFERMGGFAKVRLLVSEFYDRVLDTDTLAPYFQNIDVRRLIDHQTKFMAAVMGGPVSFTDEHLGRAHRHLHIRVEDFDEMAEILRETLEDFEVGDTEIERVMAQVRAVRGVIVERQSAPSMRSA